MHQKEGRGDGNGNGNGEYYRLLGFNGESVAGKYRRKISHSFWKGEQTKKSVFFSPPPSYDVRKNVAVAATAAAKEKEGFFPYRNV